MLELFLLLDGQQLCTLWNLSCGTLLAIERLLPDGLASLQGPA